MLAQFQSRRAAAGLRRAVMLVLDNGGLFLKTESVVGGSRSRGRGRRGWVCGRRQHAGGLCTSWALHGEQADFDDGSGAEDGSFLS